MNIEELEEALDELFPAGFAIEADKHGQLIVYTGLTQDEDGELSSMDTEEDEDFDPDSESLDDEELDEDDE
jgi:hypothetical protein